MSSQILLRLVIATLLTSGIGLERQMRQKSAGLRTHALVGLGSALIMVVSQMGFDSVLSPGRIVLDPSRVAAQVVSGIGFLGAGLIIVRQEAVRGLTTAAGIWVCAAIGLACGSGLFGAAVVTTVFAIVCIYVYGWIERVCLSRLPGEATVYVVCENQSGNLLDLTDKIAHEAQGIRLVGVRRMQERPGYVACEFHARHGLLLEKVASSLLQLPGVISVRTELTPPMHDEHA
jgi:putative Mg2+ transporter-C (MgtC) family protein